MCVGLDYLNISISSFVRACFFSVCVSLVVVLCSGRSYVVVKRGLADFVSFVPICVVDVVFGWPFVACCVRYCLLFVLICRPPDCGLRCDLFCLY